MDEWCGSITGIFIGPARHASTMAAVTDWWRVRVIMPPQPVTDSPRCFLYKYRHRFVDRTLAYSDVAAFTRVNKGRITKRTLEWPRVIERSNETITTDRSSGHQGRDPGLISAVEGRSQLFRSLSTACLTRKAKFSNIQVPESQFDSLLRIAIENRSHSEILFFKKQMKIYTGRSYFSLTIECHSTSSSWSPKSLVVANNSFWCKISFNKIIFVTLVSQ